MPADPRLAGLSRIAGLQKDMRLAALRRAEAERQALLDRLATLAERPAPPDDLPPSVAAEIALRYDRWADLRRREVEGLLRQKSQECEMLKARAREAVGRDDAVIRLIARSQG